jgi:hypothetical protein
MPNAPPARSVVKESRADLIPQPLVLEIWARIPLKCNCLFCIFNPPLCEFLSIPFPPYFFAEIKGEATEKVESRQLLIPRNAALPFSRATEEMPVQFRKLKTPHKYKKQPVKEGDSHEIR